jgi:RES domain
MTDFKSWNSFEEFNHAVHRKLRYIRTPEHEDFLKTVAETSHRRKIILKEGSNLWRARLGHDYKDEPHGDDIFQVECAYSPDQMKPLPDKASDGRANPKGIPCLYLGNRKETAVSEVRPWIGSYVSVGQFKILRNVELIDCSRGHGPALMCLPVLKDDAELTPAEIENAVWSDIDHAFAERFVARINSRAQSAPRSDIYVRRTYSGRPSSSMRFSEATAMATSVICRPPVRERSASPITRL